jgi:hypothetical protein
LELEGEKVAQCSEYVGIIKSNFIYLREEESDTLCWSKITLNGQFTAKSGYHTLFEATFGGTKHWWWDDILKFHTPLKVKLVFSVTLHQKLLTWDVGFK